MNVLISGAAGFIGSHLVERYLRDGHRVAGVDNYLTGSPENLAPVQNRVDFIEEDIADAAAVEHALTRASFVPELVLHFASPASPVDYAKLPLETMRVNSLGTQTCLEIARRHQAEFLFASTSECYGDPLEHPQRESYWGNVNSIGPRSCYDEAKRFGEALVMSWIRVHGVKARIIRIFNTYGPRMRRDDGRVVPNFIMQALHGEPLTVYGNGGQTRSFCFVDDLIEGIVRVAASERTRGEVVNLGNPDERTIREFAEVVCRLTGVELRLAHQSMPADDPARRCPDITRAREWLGWEPRVDLEQGLRRTIEAFREAERSQA